jgi:hypothetical protein
VSTAERESEDNDEQPSPSLPEDLGRKYVNQGFNAPEYQQDHDEFVEMEDDTHGRPESGMDCDDVLLIPNLREVNGRFVGPTLFDHFDESEEE